MSRGLVLVAVIAFVAQGVVALGTFLLGLGWGGPTYYAALLQVLAAFGLIGWLIGRRRRIAALVPLLSAALTAALLAGGQALAAATGCSPEVRAEVERLAAPPGVDAELTGGMEGCYLRFTTGQSPGEVGEHYRAELGEHGWELMDETDGSVAATKGDIRLTVYSEPLPDGGAGISIELFQMPSEG